MERIAQLLKQYRYGILVLLIGLGLMFLPTGSNTEEEVLSDVPTESEGIQEQLENILCQIEGAGRVRVLLSEAEGETTVYQQETNQAGDSLRQETVVITNAERAENGLICQVIPARYQGAVVVCQGGDRASVRLAVVEAVSSITGLTSDKITVLKMK